MRVCPAQSLRFCGRQFSLAELEKLRHWLAQGQCNRSELARRVCAEFGWINGAGQPKLMSSRVALWRMERAGLVRLPPPQTRNGNRRRSSLDPTTALALPWANCPKPLNPLTGLRLEVVETPGEAALYRQMMDRYHYLGHTCQAQG